VERLSAVRASKKHRCTTRRAALDACGKKQKLAPCPFSARNPWSRLCHQLAGKLKNSSVQAGCTTRWNQLLATSISDDFREIEGLARAESLIDNFTEPDWDKLMAATCSKPMAWAVRCAGLLVKAAREGGLQRPMH
jgi:hypothetical protein